MSDWYSLVICSLSCTPSRYIAIMVGACHVGNPFNVSVKNQVTARLLVAIALSHTLLELCSLVAHSHDSACLSTYCLLPARERMGRLMMKVAPDHLLKFAHFCQSTAAPELFDSASNKGRHSIRHFNLRPVRHMTPT